jgi:hypothetical protein
MNRTKKREKGTYSGDMFSYSTDNRSKVFIHPGNMNLHPQFSATTVNKIGIVSNTICRALLKKDMA